MTTPHYKPLINADTALGSLAEDGLFKSQRSWLTRFLTRRFGPDRAEDLAQEALARAAAYPEVTYPKALLLRIATNLARDQHRRDSVRLPAYGGSMETTPRQVTAADQEEALLLKQIVLGLPEPLKQTFLLSRFAGLTYSEIAQRCGVSIKTVEWRMSKALSICAARLRD